MTTTPTTITLPVTLNGETRQITFDLMSDGQRAFGHGFACRVGRGSKLHAATAIAYLRDGKWSVNLNTVALNRQARIVAFSDTVAGTTTASQHIGSAITR